MDVLRELANKALRGDFDFKFKSLHDQKKRKPVYVTGHSKGQSYSKGNGHGGPGYGSGQYGQAQYKP